MTKQQKSTIFIGILYSMLSFFLMYGICYGLLSDFMIIENQETYSAIKEISLITATLFMLFATFIFWHTEWKNKKLLKENKNGKT